MRKKKQAISALTVQKAITAVVHLIELQYRERPECEPAKSRYTFYAITPLEDLLDRLETSYSLLTEKNLE